MAYENYNSQQYRRYHYSVFFPENYKTMIENFFNSFSEVNLTNSAKQKVTDKNIPIPSKQDLKDSRNIFVEFYEPISNDVVCGYIQKLLVRVTHFSPIEDYCYVVSKEGYVVSCWINKNTDIHRLTSDCEYYSPSRNLAFVDIF